MTAKPGNNKKNSFSSPPVDRHRIVDAALELLEAEGLDQMSMRRLADRLGVRAASLYWHIKDKGELLQLLAESICERIALPEPGLRWQEQVLAVAGNYRQVLLSIRDSEKILLNTPPATPRRFALIEATFRVFADAGFSPAEVAWAAALINNYVLAFVADEAHFFYAARAQGKSVAELLADARSAFSGMAEQYPVFSSLADYATDADMDRQFAFGLYVILDGLAVRLKQ
ncbi:MAG: TetR/AcrR family transcriptional regulator C-terminal domain-containing protein [Negativicutes bacterium]|nr:TetR/AcrR family transcriptional regulator C-terminal domain-containing protein [Negativicutes bacterium]